jgi:intracellular sulfur oxidation DsrE/DsrF family protein
MRFPNELEQLTLNAFVDRELDPEQQRGVLTAMERNPSVRDHVHGLRRAKAWMRTGFGDAEFQPATTLPKPRGYNCIRRGIVASLIAVTFAAGAGLLGYIWGERQSVLMVQAENPQHILLHIDNSTSGTFEKVLDYAEAFLAEHRARGTEVEVVANAGGVDLMRVGGSRYEERVESLSRRYQNLHFLACANAIRNLRKQGVHVDVLDHVNAGETAIDHIVGRIRSGWTYLKVGEGEGI